ncbi:MAG: hypothetical protein U9Q07_06780 [Planctomycetota bacterium]|nr:hypothetical protein [Planctomycetota bacterium]
MARQNPLVVAIKERLAKRRDDLDSIAQEIDMNKADLVSLVAKRTTIQTSIDEDTELLEQTGPQRRRATKEQDDA